MTPEQAQTLLAELEQAGVRVVRLGDGHRVVLPTPEEIRQVVEPPDLDRLVEEARPALERLAAEVFRPVERMRELDERVRELAKQAEAAMPGRREDREARRLRKRGREPGQVQTWRRR